MRGAFTTAKATSFGPSTSPQLLRLHLSPFYQFYPLHVVGCGNREQRHMRVDAGFEYV